MRRMVLKHREADLVIKKVNEKITSHADFFDLENKFQKQKSISSDIVKDLEITIQKLSLKLEKET